MTLRRATLAPAAASSRDTSSVEWWVACIGLCAVLTAPLLVVDVPPLLDYPNHLARIFVLASLPHDTVLAQFYAPHWSIIPNLALDLVGPPLIRVLPVHVVGRLLIAAAVLLPVLGTITYNVALGGRWWSLGVGLVTYNSCLLYGFLNFEIALGLALLLATVWLRWREHRPVAAIALAMLGAPMLFGCHLMGLVFFGILIGSAELFRLHQVRRNGLLRDVVKRGSVLLLVFTAPVVLYAVSALRQLGGDAQFFGPANKLLQLLFTFSNYNAILDAAAAAVAVLLPVGCLLMHRGRFRGPAAIAIGFLVLTYFAAPNAWKGTYVLDTRFGVMLAFMLFAGFVPHGWPRGFRNLAACGLVVLFLARMGLLATAWADHQTDLADLRRVLVPVRPGQAVFVAEAGLDEAPGYWEANPGWRRLSNGIRVDDHLGALVLLEYRAYWPFQFDTPSQQPIVTREPYRALAGRVGFMPNRNQTAAADVCGFDYVLLMAADAVPRLPEERFRLVARLGFAALYAITRCRLGA